MELTVNFGNYSIINQIIIYVGIIIYVTVYFGTKLDDTSPSTVELGV